MADPDSAPPIALLVENGFNRILAAQLERSGYEGLDGDPAGTPHHAVVDCGVPTRADLKAIHECASRKDTLSITVVSTIDAESIPAPVLGVSAIVSPSASAERLREDLPELAGDGTGSVALPFFLLVETIGPLIEGFGYVVVPIAFLLGVLNVPFFVLFLGIAVGVGTLLSWLSMLNEVVSFRRYRDPKNVAKLLGYGLVEHVPYRQWKSWVTWVALVRYLRGESGWGEMVRIGFEG